MAEDDVSALRVEIAALAAEVSRRLDAVERALGHRPARVGDAALFERVRAHFQGAPITLAAAIRTAPDDILGAMRDAWVDTPQQLGLVFRRLEQAGIVERVDKRHGSTRWRARARGDLGPPTPPAGKMR